VYQANQSTRTASGLPRLQSLVRNKSFLMTLCPSCNARSSQVSYWLVRARRSTRSPSPKSLCDAWNAESILTPRPLSLFIFLTSRDLIGDGSKA
jgi:hypothetical protein